MTSCVRDMFQRLISCYVLYKTYRSTLKQAAPCISVSKLHFQRIEKSKQHFAVAQLAMLCKRHDVTCIKQFKN